MEKPTAGEARAVRIRGKKEKKKKEKGERKRYKKGMRRFDFLTSTR